MDMLDQDHTEDLAFELANRSLGSSVLETVTLILITATAFMGNCCVLVVLYKTPRLRRVSSFYLISLAVSDVLLSIFVMPTSVFTSAFGRNILSDEVGRLVGWIFAQSAFVSLYTTSLIAVNRFICVVKPLLYRKYFRRSTVTRTIVGVWIFLFVLLLALYFSTAIDITFYPGRVVYFVKCTNATASILTAVSHFVLIILPLALAAICYCKLYALVKTPSSSAKTPEATQDIRYSFQAKQEIQVTRCLLSLIFGFAVCWIPCSVLFHLAIYIDLSRSFEMLIVYTAYISSAINPFLYNILNKPFRKRFLKLISLRKHIIGVEGD